MRVELMEFKRCCCCIPLRYGLLISGYFKLMVSAAILVPVTIEMVELGKAFQWRKFDVNITAFTIFSLGTIVILGDIAMTIVFLIGNHKKNASLLRVYYSYSIVLLVLFVVALVLLVAHDMYRLVRLLGVLYSTMVLRSEILFGIVDICFQVYFILMTKSEIAKLENNCQFQFTNNANEAQCTMNDVGVNETNTHEAQCTMNDVGVNETNGTCIMNSEPVDQNEYINENEENDPKAKNLNGSYARFN